VTIRFEHAGQEVDERRLARPVRPHDAEPVAAQEPERQVANDRPIAEALRDPLGFDDLCARLLGLCQRHRHRSDGALLVPPLIAQGV
jgi:hypothetical protein